MLPDLTDEEAGYCMAQGQAQQARTPAGKVCRKLGCCFLEFMTIINLGSDSVFDACDMAVTWVGLQVRADGPAALTLTLGSTRAELGVGFRQQYRHSEHRKQVTTFSNQGFFY